MKSIIGQESEPVEKAKILALLRSECRALTPKPQSKAVVTEKLRDFDDKQQSAKKKTNAAKRQVTYEFSRLSAAMLKELDKAIKQVLEAN